MKTIIQRISKPASWIGNNEPISGCDDNERINGDGYIDTDGNLVTTVSGVLNYATVWLWADIKLIKSYLLGLAVQKEDTEVYIHHSWLNSNDIAKKSYQINGINFINPSDLPIATNINVGAIKSGYNTFITNDGVINTDNGFIWYGKVNTDTINDNPQRIYDMSLYNKDTNDTSFDFKFHNYDKLELSFTFKNLDPILIEPNDKIIINIPIKSNTPLDSRGNQFIFEGTFKCKNHKTNDITEFPFYYSYVFTNMNDNIISIEIQNPLFDTFTASDYELIMTVYKTSNIPVDLTLHFYNDALRKLYITKNSYNLRRIDSKNIVLCTINGIRPLNEVLEGFENTISALDTDIRLLNDELERLKARVLALESA